MNRVLSPDRKLEMRLPKAATSTPKMLEFSDVIRALKHHIMLVLTTGALCLGGAVYYLSSITPTYTSGGQLLLGGQGLSEQNSFDLVEAQVLSNAVIEGEIAIMRSNEILINVVQKLNLDEDPEFNPSLREVQVPSPLVTWLKDTAKAILGRGEKAEETTQNAEAPSNTAVLEAASLNKQTLGEYGASVGILRKGLSIRQQGTSFLMSIQTTSESPQKAAAISNTVMTEYIRVLADKRFQTASRFTGWLEGRVEELASNLEESERAVLELRSVMEADADNGARLDQQMQEFTTKLVNARAELAQAEAQVRRATLVSEQDGPLATANILSSEAIFEFRRALVDLRREEAETALNFSEDSARMESIRRAITKTETELSNEVENLILQLNNRVETMRLNVRTLETSLRSFEGLNLERSRQLIEMNQLQRVADINRRVYEDFLGRYREISEFQEIPISDARIIRYASPPGSPSHPRKKVAAILALVGGLSLGAALAFLLEWRPKRLSEPRQISRATGLPVFGTTPRLKKIKTAENLLDQLGHNDSFAQAALKLADSINLHSERALRSIFVTSYSANKSRTNTAIMLAWANAQRGRKCVLVDGDFRNAQLTESFGLSEQTNFLSAIHSDKPLNECLVVTSADDGFDCIGAEVSAADPSVLYSSERMQDMIALLRKVYDVVIIDAPSLEDSSNNFASLPSRDLGVFTIETKTVTLDGMNRSLNMLRDMDLGGAGIVLNGSK